MGRLSPRGRVRPGGDPRKTRSLSGSRSSSLFADNSPAERHAARAPGLHVGRQRKKGRKTYSIYSGSQKKKVVGKLGRRKRPGLGDASGTRQNPPTIVVQQCADSIEVEENPDETEPAAPKKGICRLKLSELIGPQNANIADEKASKRKAPTQAKKKKKPMSHIRAKWLLGLSLTMVITCPSHHLLTFCVEGECNESRFAAAAGAHQEAKSPRTRGRGKKEPLSEDVRLARGARSQDQRGLGEGAAGAGSQEKGGEKLSKINVSLICVGGGRSEVFQDTAENS